jgi:hypothetical protein
LIIGPGAEHFATYPTYPKPLGARETHQDDAKTVHAFHQPTSKRHPTSAGSNQTTAVPLFHRKERQARYGWLTHVILATQEAEIRRIKV